MRVLGLLLAAVFLARIPGAAQVRVQTGPEGVPVAGGQAGAARGDALGSSLSGAALNPPSLLPALDAPLLPSVDAVVPGAGTPEASRSLVLAAPDGPGDALPVSAIRSATLSGNGVVAVAESEAKPGGAAGPALSSVAREDGTETGPESESEESQTQTGRTAFDGTAPGGRGADSLWDRVRNWFKPADSIPAFPGRPGDSGRIDGRRFSVGSPALKTADWTLHEGSLEGHTNLGIRLFKPGSAALAAELEGLGALARTDIPHAKVLAAAPGAGLLIQEGMVSRSLRSELAKGPFSEHQKNGLPELAAKLIRQGRTADLGPDNLFWDHWLGRWNIVSGVGFRPGGAWEVLSQMLGAGVPERAGFDPLDLLAALRGRLGPRSQAWAAVVSAAQREPGLRSLLEGLARRDADRPAPPRLSFTGAAPDKTLDNSVVAPAELSRRLGFDPLSVKGGVDLHADDPGKLNTRILRIQGRTGPPRVLKSAEARIIRNEVFLRKVVRRWFARYFEVPDALAVLDGYGSYMVMTYADGSTSWAGPVLSREQRVALAVLVHAFGVSDMNPGNLLFGKGRVTLLDFEQALGRRTPVPTRLGSTGLIDELPWVKSRERVPAEDFAAGIQDWREHLARPETRRELERMLAESGFSPAESAGLLAVFAANTADLQWTVQTDVEYAANELRQ